MPYLFASPQRRFIRLPVTSTAADAARGVAARCVTGRFGGGNHAILGVRMPLYKASPARSRSGSAADAALAASSLAAGSPPQEVVGGWQVAGLWGPTGAAQPCNPCAFELDAGCTTCVAGGWVLSGAEAALGGANGGAGDGSKPKDGNAAAATGGAAAAAAVGRSGSWALVKDNYVILACKRVFGSLWRGGREVHSERVSELSAQALLDRSLAGASTLGGDNKRECSECGKRCDTMERTVLHRPPRHLILTLKRMWFDWRANRTIKMLQHVAFDAWLRVPRPPPAAELPAELAAELHGGGAAAAPLYGLYAVVVHAGLSANSGHYYAFCRPSSARGLWRRDLPMAPWTKYNDAKVSTSSWRAMMEHLGAAQCNSAYLLFHRRLDDGETAGFDAWRREQRQAELASGAVVRAALDLTAAAGAAAGGVPDERKTAGAEAGDPESKEQPAEAVGDEGDDDDDDEEAMLLRAMALSKSPDIDTQEPAVTQEEPAGSAAAAAAAAAATDGADADADDDEAAALAAALALSEGTVPPAVGQDASADDEDLAAALALSMSPARPEAPEAPPAAAPGAAPPAPPAAAAPAEPAPRHRSAPLSSWALEVSLRRTARCRHSQRHTDPVPPPTARALSVSLPRFVAPARQGKRSIRRAAGQVVMRAASSRPSSARCHASCRVHGHKPRLAGRSRIIGLLLLTRGDGRGQAWTAER
jgi:hypothetical protein